MPRETVSTIAERENMTRVGTTVALLATLALAGGLRAADDPAKKAGDSPAPVATSRGQLPPNFKKLGLTDEQREKIYTVQATYRARIAELSRKLRELRKQELAEEMQVLTDSQKERLKELVQERATGESGKKSAAGTGNANQKNEKDKK